MGSAIPAAKAALIADLPSVLGSSVQVVYGHPGAFLADDIVSVGNASSTREYGPMGTQRRLTETLSLTLTVSVWRGGLQSQQPATEAAFDLLDLIESYLTDVGTPDSDQLTLGHAVWRAWVDRLELTETEADMTDADGQPLLNQGRIAEIVATISATARI